jgi:hypothetical protein
MSINLIGLYSSAMGSGKTALTDVLAEKHGWVPVKFAGTLKDMVKVLLKDLGIQNPTEFTDGPNKEMVLEDLGCSTRVLMQTLGTEWGRKIIKPSIWIDLAVAKIQRLQADGWRVVVDDMRFPNEFQAIKDLGGKAVHVIRPGLQDATGHCSEGALDKHPFDFALMNVMGLDEWRGLASWFHERLVNGLQVESAK